MKTRYRYLEDTAFLKELSLEHIKTYLAKVTVLNWAEEPISSIEGRVISASINIDGQSSMRRTANLSIAIDGLMNNITNTQNILSINKKMMLEIGYLNDTRKYTQYNIFWFPLGTYVIISCSISHSDTGLVASLQLQDKMCLLNGTVGGIIPAAADFHVREEADGTEVKVPIYQIIQEVVNHWGGEQLGKILISDLDNLVPYGMRWNLKNPLYQVIFNNDASRSYFCLTQQEAYQRAAEDAGAVINVIEQGHDVGFVNQVFAYPDQLVCDAGAAVTDILERIIQVLGNYEYFYDIDGNFRFQEKKNFLNNSQAKYILEAQANKQLVPQFIAKQQNQNLINAYLMDMSKGTPAFSFQDSNMIKSYSNTPQYGAIKNDFVIWGIRTDIQKKEWPIRYHLAIDKIPMLSSDDTYFGFEKKEVLYVDNNGNEVLSNRGVWKLPILLLEPNETLDKYKANSRATVRPEASYDTLNRYYFKFTDKNYTTGILYETFKNSSGNYQWRELDEKPISIQVKDWRTQLLLQGAAAQAWGLKPSVYYEQLKNEWPKIYDVANAEFYKETLEKPYQLDYYLDFIDTGNSSINQFSIDNIGRRSYVVNNGKNTNCIFENAIPDIFLIKNGQIDTADKREYCKNKGQKYILVPPEIYDNLDIGGIYNSAYQDIRQTIHQFTSYNETITIQTLPLYFLQPNTRISVFNPQSNIYGDYMIDSMSFALDAEGLLTINASRALQKV